MHGGKSTGPRTPDGLARSRRARWKHGRYSVEEMTEQKRAHDLIRQSRELLEKLWAIRALAPGPSWTGSTDKKYRSTATLY